MAAVALEGDDKAAVGLRCVFEAAGGISGLSGVRGADQTVEGC